MTSRPSLSKRKTISSLLFLLLIATTPISQARVDLSALRRDGYGMVDLQRPEPNVLVVTAIINGRKARLIVDTGWGQDGLTVDSSYLKVMRLSGGSEDIGYSAGGMRIGRLQKGTADVAIGNVALRQVPIFAGKIGALEHSSAGIVSANGFIGCNFLKTCSAIVDLHNLRLYLRPPGTGRRAVIAGAMKAQGLNEAPLVLNGHNCFVPVEINGAKGGMFVDTGANLAGVDRRFLSRLKDVKYRSSRVETIDASGAIAASGLIDVRSFFVAGVPVFAPDLRVGLFGFYPQSKGIIVGLLGMDILGKNGTIIDFGEKKLYLYGLQAKKSNKPAPKTNPPAKTRKV